MALVINGKMKQNKLLYITLTSYSIVAVVIITISAPVFYLFTKKLYINDADEALNLRKKEFLLYHLPVLKKEDIDLWNRFNRDITIKDNQTIKEETIVNVLYYDSIDEEYEPYRELIMPICIDGNNYIYTARVNLIETEDILKNILVLFIAIIFLMLVGLFFITKKLSIIIWKPFYETLQEIENFELDKTTHTRFNESRVEEFNRLNQSIEKLITRNLSIYKSQREFVENAAHELQTPLAVFQAKFDSLMQSGEFTEEQYRILNSINENISRLSRLNKNLLLLSKIESEIYTDKQEINLSDLMKKQIEFFSEQATAKKISFEIVSFESVFIEANPFLVEILVGNLFHNAIRHNVADGTIKISLNKDSLSISNTGITKPLNQEKLFRRFSKENITDQGSGLGLAIVKKVAELSGFKVAYSFDGHFHTFSLNF